MDSSFKSSDAEVKQPAERWLLGSVAYMSHKLGWHCGATRALTFILAFLFPLPVVAGYVLVHWFRP